MFTARPETAVPLILLDFDGVVAQTESLARGLLAEMAGPVLNRSVAAVAEVIFQHPGLRFTQMQDHVHAALGVRLEGEALDAFARHYEAETLTLFQRQGLATAPDLVETLEAARQRYSAAVRICSNSSARRLAVSLSSLKGGQGARVRAVIDDVNPAVRLKPDPQVYADAIGSHLALYGALPRQVIIVEDSAAGAAAGLAARPLWPEVSIQVLGYTPLTHRPDHAHDSLVALPGVQVVDGSDWSFLLSALESGPT